MHKQQCTGRVEAAKLTTEQLDQLDLLVSLETGGTMEFPDADHDEKFLDVENQLHLEKHQQGAQETAVVRTAKQAKSAKKAKKELPSVHLAVSHQQKLALEGARSDIFGYFGSSTYTLLSSSPGSSPF